MIHYADRDDPYVIQFSVCDVIKCFEAGDPG